MERLLARRAHDPQAGTTALHIHLIDPFEPGAGHVWRAEQSRLYLMNTQSFFPTPRSGMRVGKNLWVFIKYSRDCSARHTCPAPGSKGSIKWM